MFGSSALGRCKENHKACVAQAFVAPRDFGSAPAQSDAMRIGLKVLFGNLEDWGAYWEARSATVHCKLIDFPAFVLLKAEF